MSNDNWLVSLGEARYGVLDGFFDGLSHFYARSKLAMAGALNRDQLFRLGPPSVYNSLGDQAYESLVVFLQRQHGIKWPNGEAMHAYSHDSDQFYDALQRYVTEKKNPVMTATQAKSLLTVLEQHSNPSLNDLARMTPDEVKKVVDHKFMDDFLYIFLRRRIMEVKPIVDAVDAIMGRDQKAD